MIERQQQIKQYSQEFLQQRFAANIEGIQKEYNLNSERITNDFFTIFYSLLQKAKNMQEQHRKGNIAYICISYLRTSLYTGSYEYQIDLYDSNFYLDTMELSTNWKPLFIMNYYEEDIRKVTEYLQKKIIRLSNIEIEKIKEWYSYHYYSIIQKFCEDKIEDIKEIIKASHIQMENKFYILFGGYMEKSKILFENNIH